MLEGIVEFRWSGEWERALEGRGVVDMGDGWWRMGFGPTDKDCCSGFQDESVKAGVCSPVWSQRPFESFVVMIAV